MNFSEKTDTAHFYIKHIVKSSEIKVSVDT